MPTYATRTLVLQSPVDDGNEIFEGGDPTAGYQRGGFVNSNTTGVTEVDATLAAMSTSGVELSIPLFRIGDGGVYPDDTIHLLILTMDADEYGEHNLSGGFGTVINQFLPALGGGSGACDPPSGLGMRPDLSTAACLTIDLSTVAPLSPTAVLEGVIDPADYAGGAPFATQSCPTSAGDQARTGELLLPLEDGSELDALYVDNDETYLYLGLTGNLQVGGTSINVFVDAGPGAGSGDRLISDFSDFAFSGTYDAWETATITAGPTDLRVESTDFGGGWYYVSPAIHAPGATTLILDATVNAANQADVIRVLLVDGDQTERVYELAVPGPGTYTFTTPLSNYAYDNAPGSEPGLDLSSLSFFHLAGGANHGDPGVAFDVTFDRLALADADSGEHVLDFDPGPELFTETPVCTFSDFHLGGTYGSWGGGTVTSGSTNLRIEASGGFGGGWADLSPDVDATRAISVQMDVTLNAANSPGGVLLVFEDGDGTQLRWSWFGLEPDNSYTLTGDLGHGDLVQPGSVAGFDLSTVSFFHIQGDFPTTDIVFDNIALVDALPGVTPILSLNGDELANGPLDVLNNQRFVADAAAQYDYVYSVNVGVTPHRAYVNYFDLANDLFAFRGAVEPNSGSAVLFDDPGGVVAENPNGLMMAFNNMNTSGVMGCADGDPCFLADAETVAALARQATTGMEMAIPLADLGLNAGDLPRVIQLWTMVSGPLGFATDQSLPSMRNGTGGGNQVYNPGNAPVNFTNPGGGSAGGTVLSDFSDFALTETYAQWASAAFTSGPDDFRVVSTDFGGGLYDLVPNVDAGAAAVMQLDVTFNPANETDKLVVILVDGDGTERVYRFENLTNGTHTLTRDLSDFNNDNAPGAVPGLDLSDLNLFHVAGAFHNGMPGAVMDVTFDNLILLSGPRNFEARAARVCVGTVAGDADCDGDNDLEDFGLLQQCVGVEAAPVLPLACELLDLDRSGQVDAADVDGFNALLEAP